ncbi:MAG TPA: acyl-CoA dehydrogenase family protein, partial [Tianweitania sediminis]|nr:acyl-CoA dehydrogenase family protein [Tianweitania sediminis]
TLAILRFAGNAALAVPLAETMLAGWMLGVAGIEMPAGRIAFGPTSSADRVMLRDNRLSGRIARMPFARDCNHAALLASSEDGLRIVLVELSTASLQPADNLAFEPVDRVFFENTPIVATAATPDTFTAETTLLMGAASRSMQIAGALETMLAIATDYAGQRRAFERPISKFQAIQHSIAQLAGEVAVSLSAAASAAEALETLIDGGRRFDDPELLLEVISAKVRASSAATKGSAIAHQLFGAIGVTREHILHRLTLRALAWRDDYGNESHWSERLGRMVSSRGAPALWPLLATR